MSTRLDPLEHLERGDKWHVGGGRAALFAPPFPRWLDRFGFWDEAHFADVRLDRLFTVLLLGENERPLKLRPGVRRWTPDALTHTHSTDDGLQIREDKIVTPSDTFVSRITVRNDGKRHRTLNLVLWSLQVRADLSRGRRATSAEDAARAGDYLLFTHRVEYGENPYADRPAENAGWGERPPRPTVPQESQALHIALGADRAPDSFTVNLAEPADTSPLWEISVVPEKLRGGLLPCELHPSGQAGSPGANEGHLHLCLHYRLQVPTGETRSIQFGAAVNLDRGRALHHAQNDLRRDAARASRESWHAAFAGVPYFECSDRHLQKYYWHRWQGLRMLTVDLSDAPGRPEGGGLTHPCVFEGIGGFRSHISYSAQCHMLEAGWMHDPRLAMGCLEGMLAAQEHSGFIPGHLYLWREGRGFYHANWGGAALQLFHLTGDTAFVDRVYPGLSRYADYFERERDREDSHLYDIVDQGETGQEYMSRCLFVDARADDWRRIQLKGVDATVYVYLLQRALARMAAVLGKGTESTVWDRKADATAEAVRQCMWDPERHFFCDVDPRTGARSPHHAAVGFYPFLTDIAGPEHLPAIHEHLLDPGRFWTPWPFPACSPEDPTFSAEGEWRGRRMSCPWNGRVWPMATSHLCAALARAARELDEALRPRAADAISRFVRMMFHDGDPERPNCFEHYNPFTAAPSTYRGIDDYMHSWVVDLLIKEVAGLRPDGGPMIVVDPLDFGLSRFRLESARIRGHTVDVSWDAGDGLLLTVDGKVRARRSALGRLEAPLDAA